MISFSELAENIRASARFSGEVRTGEPLAPHTTMRTGGTAPLFALPDNAASLADCLDALHKAAAPYFVLGGGSNVVFPDGDFARVVVATEKLDALAITGVQTILHCGAGCKMDSAVRYCAEHNLGGLEEFSGLPGTVGGAVYMNARCYEKQVSDVLVNVEFTKWEEGRGTWGAREYRLDFADPDWGYKQSPFQGNACVILGASFAVSSLAEEEVKASVEKATGFFADREKKRHFDYPSAGSVFKNNHEFGKPSGMIIDEAGLRGYRIGGAQVAPWHGNIIINTGNATSADIRALADYVTETVFAKFGLRLEPAIIFL
jgi:UDP-N-acetylmuramate dehydrogenase